MDIIELTPQARRFAEEYLIDFKASAAALRAGYADGSIGYHMLKDFRVDALIREGRRKISERVEISVDNTLEIIRRIAHADIVPILIALKSEDPINAIAALPDDQRLVIKSLKWTKNGPEVTLHDQLAAAQMLGKYFGVFVEKHEHTGAGGGPVQMITATMSPKEAADAYAATLTEGA